MQTNWYLFSWIHHHHFISRIHKIAMIYHNKMNLKLNPTLHNLYMKAFGEATPDSAPVYFWGCKWSNPWLRPLEPSSIQPDGRFIHPSHKRTVEPDSTSNCHEIQRCKTSHRGRRRRRVPCVTSSSCPWQQKVNSKQGRAGARVGQCRGRVGTGQGRASRAVKNKE